MLESPLALLSGVSGEAVLLRDSFLLRRRLAWHQWQVTISTTNTITSPTICPVIFNFVRQAGFTVNKEQFSEQQVDGRRVIASLLLCCKSVSSYNVVYLYPVYLAC